MDNEDTRTSSEALAPCPFCGGEVVPCCVYSPNGYAFGCPHCRMKGPIYKTHSAAEVPAEAIAAWNTRPQAQSTRTSSEMADCPICDGEAANFTPASGKFCIACGQSGQVMPSTANILRNMRPHLDGDARRLEALTAQLTRQSEAAGSVVWLVEFPATGDAYHNGKRIGPATPVQYFCAIPNGHNVLSRTANPHDAMRFARKQDAEAMVRRLDSDSLFSIGVKSGGFACEHMWIDEAAYEARHD